MTIHPEDQLSAYIDNELSEYEKKQVENHIATCDSCQALMNELIAMQSDLKQAFYSIQEPADLEDRVLQSIEIEKESVGFIKGWLLIPFLAVLVICIIFFSIGGFLIKLIHGSFTLLTAMVYMISHFISSLPVFSGVTVVLSLTILTLSIYTLRRMFQTTTS
ncbi:zf-HC2 domain-containing protein [Paenibacillus sp. KQZ6P-2]|uniref:Anti-sigma-W factor RsiW n=1 Tax=Paenibacillus mangrovi TaxID=2931978 RepID=A0A9X2B3P0_9BACL|nr:zf-HC2 domain-containing protein [Paenibacillus mangrovi]MCJ8013621.1 zf-HC2 domain-containing protein [Paenibacillus mangrovi]